MRFAEISRLLRNVPLRGPPAQRSSRCRSNFRCAAIRSAVVRWPGRNHEWDQIRKIYRRDSHHTLICVCDAYGNVKSRRECAMNNHSDDRQLREKWERWTRTPADVIRNDRTGVTHLAVSHQDYTLCGINGLRRIRRHGLLNLIKQLPMENAAQEATCHICKRHSSLALL